MAIILKGSPSASINTSHKLQPKQPGVELLDNGYSRLKIGSTTNLSNLDDSSGWIEWSNLPYATPDSNIYTDTALVAPDTNFQINANHIIPFAGTSYVGNSTQAFDVGYFNSLHVSSELIPLTIRPASDLTGSIGAPLYRFNEAYFGTINLSTSISPSANGAGTVGSSLFNFNAGYFQNLYTNILYPNGTNSQVGTFTNHYTSGYFDNLYTYSGSTQCRVPNLLFGAGTPSDSTGQNGDIYIQYVV